MVGKNASGAAFYVHTPQVAHHIVCCQACRAQRIASLEQKRPGERLKGILLLILGVVALIACYALMILLTNDITASETTWGAAILMLALPCIPGVVLLWFAAGNLKRGFKNPQTLMMADALTLGKQMVSQQIKPRYPADGYFVCEPKELGKYLQGNNQAITYRNKGYLH